MTLRRGHQLLLVLVWTVCLTLLTLQGPALLEADGAWSRGPGASAAAPAGTMAVRGVVTYAGGGPIKHAHIDAFNLTADRNPRRLDEAVTTAKGAFTLVIERRSSLAKYAEHHNGRLNLVLWVGKGKRLFIRNERVAYNRAGKSPTDDYHLGHVKMLASQPLRARTKVLDEKNGEVIDTHWDTIARISASKDFTTNLRYYQNLETSVSFGIMSTGTFQASGSMSMAEQNGTSLEAELAGYRHARQEIDVEVEHRRVTACEWRPWMVIDGQACVDYVVSDWNGDFRDQAAAYRDCGSLPARYQTWHPVKRIGWSVTKTKGKSFTSSWGLSGLGGTIQSSTVFSDTNYQSWHVPDKRHTVVDKFCVGGVDGTWDAASEVLTQSELVPPPCHKSEKSREPRRC